MQNINDTGLATYIFENNTSFALSKEIEKKMRLLLNFKEQNKVCCLYVINVKGKMH